MTQQERIKNDLLNLINGMDTNLLQRLTDYANGLIEGASAVQEDNWVPTKEELQGIQDALKESESGNLLSSNEAEKRLSKPR